MGLKELKLNDGDIYVVNGNIQTVEKEEKLNQQIQKIVLTEKGNYLHQNYGSEISTVYGSGQGLNIDGQIIATIRDALEYFIGLQKTNILLRNYDPEEILYKVLKIFIQQSDPRASYPIVHVMNGATKNVDIQFNVFQ